VEGRAALGAEREENKKNGRKEIKKQWKERGERRKRGKGQRVSTIVAIYSHEATSEVLHNKYNMSI